MNTHGHEDVAKDAGLPLLEQAFQPLMGQPRMGAFYLGNWIADVCNLVDPNIEANISEKVGSVLDQVKKYVDDIFDTVLNSNMIKSAKELGPLSKGLLEYESAATHLKTRLHATFEAFIKEVLKIRTGKQSYIHMVVQAGMLLKGYFKFVHPEPSTQGLRMDLGAYVGVIDALFIQYYPHEHMDRPRHPSPGPVPPGTGNSQYDDRRSTGPRSPNLPKSQSPDLYYYLRDFLEILAGQFADLDLDWYSRVFSQPPVDDADLTWNLNLAKLGYALHGIEDFFAHSNFIEHAALVMGNRYIPYVFQFIDSRRFLKRLKKYDYLSDPADWTLNAEEDYLVTGYYDIVDTFYSFVHVIEGGLVGIKDIDPVDASRHGRLIYDWIVEPEETDEKIVKYADKVIHDFLEIVTDPKKLNTVNEENEVVKAVKKVIDETFLGDEDKLIDALRNPATRPEDLKVLVEHMPVLREINKLRSAPGVKPEQVAGILQTFFDFVRVMMVTFRIGKFTFSLYETLSEVTEFCADPPLWIIKQLKGAALQYALNSVIFFSKESIYGAMGMERIGCHSLISKDHGEEVLYDEMKACATAVHYYLVQTMLRWSQPGYANRPENEKWVDWLEILEYFTLHPQANVICTQQVEVPVEKFHYPTPAELQRGLKQLFKDLAAQYQPVTLMPTGVPFNENKIFHANFQMKVNKKELVAIAEDKLLTMVSPPLVPVMRLRRIVIPYIRHKLNICDPTAVGPRWYMSVIKDGWEVAKNPGLIHTLKYHSSQQGASDQKNRGKNLRQQWEVFYRPENQRVGP